MKALKYLFAMTVLTAALTFSASAAFMVDDGVKVPDSGSTVMLLGVALGAAEVLRRLILKKR